MTDLSKLKWTDTSTADPIEKARRVLNHLIEPDGAFFFQDGFPRSNDIAMNAASVLAVLNALSASNSDRSFISPLDGRRIDPDALDAKYRISASIADTAGATYPPCKGMNCGATDGISHSPECHAEHAAAAAGGRFVKDADTAGAKPIPVPTVIDRSHANQAYVTYGFRDEAMCTEFINATNSHRNPLYAATPAPSVADAVGASAITALRSARHAIYMAKNVNEAFDAVEALIVEAIAKESGND
ncbi:hypothetical protein [Caballeronia glebae]|uniref:hypothetical protein n=1 Tax=Caballeronia glebae TaxID=1777143 RepID=UPI0038BB9377